MPTIQDQLDLEEHMVNKGVERFRSQQAAAQETRNSETSAGSTLLRSYVIRIADHIKLYLDGKHPDGRRRNKVAKLIATIDPDKVALLGLRAIINSIHSPNNNITTMCMQIGMRCEDELRFVHFETEYKEYNDSLLRDFDRKNIASYSHKRNVLRGKGEDRGLQWTDWSGEDRVAAGALIVSLIMEVTDLVKKQKSLNKRNQTIVLLVPTDECLDWINRHNDSVEVMSPDRMPCIIPPADWVSNTEGGFYSPELRARTPLIKSNSYDGSRKHAYQNAEMPAVTQAINAMQRTGWRVNTRLKDVMQYVWKNNLECGMPRAAPIEFPACPLDGLPEDHKPAEGSPLAEAFDNWKAEMRELYTAENERRAKSLAFSRTMRLAQELTKHDEFFYVYQTDFRGRVYATAAGLNPQGTDHSKALIEFSEGKALGEDGFRWFMINGANKYGYDKASYDDRVAWVFENAQQFMAAADDPIGNRGVWTQADKPWQFLAWCFEFRDCMELADHRDFVSHLPVGLDGSCNGLQHFSAMLRDSVGGSAVNLMPAETPADIYQRVADVCYAKLKAMDTPAAKNWLFILGDSMPRSLAKTPVMTLPYGSTQQACTGSIYKWYREKAERSFAENTAFKHCIFLAPILWESIGEVVIAARAAMKWIQDASAIIGKAGHGLTYTSPLGFPVIQKRMKFKTRQIETQIGGKLFLRVASNTNDIDVRKQRQGSSPNQVHHVDATHMMMVIVACLAEGINSFAMIHDDFGTHAADAGKLQRIIQEQFVKLHSENDLLKEFKEAHEKALGIELPPLPEKGDLDLEQVLNSPYFFG